MFNPVFSFTEQIEISQGALTLSYLNEDENIEKNLELFCSEHAIKLTQFSRNSFLAKGLKLDCNNEESNFVILKLMKKDRSPDMFRDITASFFMSIPNTVKVVNIILPCHIEHDELFHSADYVYQSLVEGIWLGCYKFDRYLSEREEGEIRVNLIGGTLVERERTTKAASVTMEGVSLARELANEPASVINPVTFAKKIEELFGSRKFCTVEIFDERKLTELEMRGILAVGSGSVIPPRLTIINYRHPEATKTVALVGKGVTFDSGGISIKPAQNMGWMKADMSGAAAVAGAMLNVVNLELPLNVTAVIPLAENMLSGSAFRPGDIVITYSKKSVEIDNTDAEGRMILADALWYASEQNPDIIIDLATLTGACAVALGDSAAGLFTKNDELADQLYKNGHETFERVWRLPMWDNYHKLNKSDVADVKNTGGRYGGAISAAKFLENFVKEGISWAHLDIAAPAIANNSTNYTKTWMTGFGVRLLTRFLGDSK
jgi:leucyl aminopeptidase